MRTTNNGRLRTRRFSRVSWASEACHIHDNVSRQVKHMPAMTHADPLDKGTNRDTCCVTSARWRCSCRVNSRQASNWRPRAVPTTAVPSSPGTCPTSVANASHPCIWASAERVNAGWPFSGLRVRLGASRSLVPLVRQFKKERAPTRRGRGRRICVLRRGEPYRADRRHRTVRRIRPEPKGC